jgi:nucleoside phosphorylase
MKGTQDPTDILIVSAHLPELVGLRSTLGEFQEANVGGLAVVARPVGIGIPAAAVGTALELGRDPRAVIFVGTAGAYPGRGMSVGQVVVGRTLHLVSAAAATERGAFPAPMPVFAETAPRLCAELARGGLREASVATTLAITTEDNLAASICASVDADVEHLEAFAVATACARTGTPFGIVLGIANVVGATARAQWQAHHEAAGAAATEAVADWLHRGAPGIDER